MIQKENKPVKKFRAGAISASIWENSDPQPDGTIRIQYSITFQKRYRDKEGEWNDSDSYFPNDIARLHLVTQKAFEYIILKEDNDTKESAPA